MPKRNFESGHVFHSVDFIILGLMLTISMAIGIYYAYLGRKKKTFKEYFTASGKMGVFPTSVSLVATAVSSIFYIGMPAEVYSYGSHFVFDIIMIFFSIPIAATGFVPVFYELKLTSANEYLELRFNKTIRRCSSFIYLISSLIGVTLIMFIPALSISQVTGLHIWISISSMCLVGTIYTALGGIRAVMWADVFQMLIILTSLFAIAIKGTIDAGGIKEVFVKGMEGDRVAITPLSFDPRLRYNLPMMIVSCFVVWMITYGTAQTQIQRYASLPTLKAAQQAVWWNVPAFVVIEGIILYIGVVLYAIYKDCDPLLNEDIETSDELVTFYVIQVFGQIPGLTGLFVSGVFSGALSTISSDLNSMAAVTMEDFVKAIPRFKSMKDSTATRLASWIAFFYGISTMAVMILVERIESIFGFFQYNMVCLGGCVFGLFFLGLFCPWADSLGAEIGFGVSVIILLLFSIGGQIYDPQFPKLVLSTEGCNATDWNSTQIISSNFSSSFDKDDNLSQETNYAIEEIFKCSPMAIEIFVYVTVVLVGAFASLFTGRKTKVPVEPRLVSPYVRRFLKSNDRKIRDQQHDLKGLKGIENTDM